MAAATLAFGTYENRSGSESFHLTREGSSGLECPTEGGAGASDSFTLSSGGRDTFHFQGLSLEANGSLGLDQSNDLLDPTRGYRILGRLSPEISFQGGTFPYARLQLDGSAYHPDGCLWHRGRAQRPKGPQIRSQQACRC